jgi:hypothetical protein
LVVVGMLCGFVFLAWAQKKGGEKCEKDSDCQTNKCSSGTCDPCPDRNNCPPPGTCSQSDHDSYGRNQDQVCDKPRSCLKVTDFNEQEAPFGELDSRLKLNNACINARTEVMDKCFKTGDDNHRRVRETVITDRDKCTSLIDTKKGKYLLYTCSQSDYESYDRNIASSCRKDDLTCPESTNDDPVDCRKIEDRITAGGKCIAARTEMASRCFDNRWNWKRQSSREADELLINKCVEVLKHKKSKSLCK